MLRISAGLAICLAAAVTAGCGTTQASHAVSETHSAAPAKAPNHGPPSGCQGPALAGSTARTLVITLAGNAKTYCARVGGKLRVDLRGTDSSPWLRPLVGGDALVPVAGGATASGITSASFAAVRPGRVIMTSVRPPCRIAVTSGKNELEPAFPLPKLKPIRSCASAHRFSVLVIVTR